MAEADKVFAGSIPEIYDSLMVPLIFEPYAADLVARVAATNPGSVLETAAGTGVVTRAMASLLGSSVRIVATDLNQPMLDRAASRLADDKRIVWKRADATALPFPDQDTDVVVCQFGAMFFPDRVQGYKEAYRVLKPGGRFIFNVWDKISENDFAATVTDALAEVFPHDPPRFMARTPHGYYDVDQIRNELMSAAFSNVSIDAVDHRSKATSPRDVAVAYCQGTPFRNEIEARGAPGLDKATDRVAEAMARRFGNGPVDGRIRAYVITAVR